jgi:hypothetical protein
VNQHRTFGHAVTFAHGHPLHRGCDLAAHVNPLSRVDTPGGHHGLRQICALDLDHLGRLGIGPEHQPTHQHGDQHASTQ